MKYDLQNDTALFNGIWHGLALPLTSFTAEPAFDSTEVTAIEFATDYDTTGRKILLADISFGGIASYPGAHAPIVFYDGYTIDNRFTSSLFYHTDAASGFETGGGMIPGSNAIRWIQGNPGSTAKIRWNFSPALNMKDMFNYDTLKFSIKAPSNCDTLNLEFVCTGTMYSKYRLPREDGYFDGTWRTVEIPLAWFTPDVRFDPTGVIEFHFNTDHSINGLPIYLTQIWIGIPASPITSIHNNDGGTMHYALSQNYPNPFNPSTFIRYQLTQRNHVAIKIFDILGRVVTTLVDRSQPAGDYTVFFDASGLASGVYFYRLEAGSFVSVKKMVLLK